MQYTSVCNPLFDSGFLNQVRWRRPGSDLSSTADDNAIKSLTLNWCLQLDLRCTCPSTNSSMPVTKWNHLMQKEVAVAISWACPFDPLGLWKQIHPLIPEESRQISPYLSCRTDDVDPDPSFELGSPSSGE